MIRVSTTTWPTVVAPGRHLRDPALARRGARCAGAAGPAPGAILLDAGCGGGLLAPHVQRLGYRHVGVDLRRAGLEQAATRGVTAVIGDVTALPLADGCADVVVAGEILEHVTDLPGTVAELSRVLRPGGLLVLDTVNDTALGRFITVTAGERLGIAPVGLHDPALFVDPKELTAEFARHGINLIGPGHPSDHDRAAALAGAAGAADRSAARPRGADLQHRRALPGQGPQGRGSCMIDEAKRLAPRFAARAAAHDRDGSFPADDFADMRAGRAVRADGPGAARRCGMRASPSTRRSPTNWPVATAPPP